MTATTTNRPATTQQRRKAARLRALARLASFYPTDYRDCVENAPAGDGRYESARRALARRHPEIYRALVAEESFGIR